LARYDEILSQSDIPAYQQPHYRKWLRFYLDFCAKYDHPPLDRDTVRAFLHKLAEKTVAEWMRKQATDAVRLYFVQGDAVAQKQQQVPGGSLVARCARDQPSAPLGSPDARSAIPNREGRAYPHAPPTPPPGPRDAPSPGAEISPTGSCRQGGRTIKSPEPTSASPVPPAPAVTPAPSAIDSSPTAVAPNNWPALYDRVTTAIKVRHYSGKTLKSYTSWARKLQGFVRNKPPVELTIEEVKSFLTFLAVERRVSASSQNQAFNALLFIFRHVLGKEFGEVEGVVRAKKRPYVPVVLAREEVKRLIERLAPPFDLPAKLLYGCGLRLFECLKLRVQDVDLEMGMLTVHDGKGQKDRTLPLPQVLMPELRAQLERVARVRRADLAAGYSGTFLPNRYEQKSKSAATELSWQWFFPAAKLTPIPGTSERRRYHLHETALQKALKTAVQERVSPSGPRPIP
jgi:integrase